MAEGHIQTATVSASGYVPFVHVRELGVLHGVAVAGGTGYHYFRITLDGRQLVDAYLSGILSGPAHGNNGLSIELPFEEEMLIEVQNGGRSPQTVFWASYSTEGQPSPEGSSEVVEESDEVEHVFVETETTKVLVGPARYSRVRLDLDSWFLGEDIRGQLELRDHRDEGLEEEAVSLILRAAGRRRPLIRVATVAPLRGDARFEIPFETFREMRLLPPSAYLFGLGMELVADLPGYANYPAAVLFVGGRVSD